VELDVFIFRVLKWLASGQMLSPFLSLQLCPLHTQPLSLPQHSVGSHVYDIPMFSGIATLLRLPNPEDSGSVDLHDVGNYRPVNAA
jgi:hypothetical protein